MSAVCLKCSYEINRPFYLCEEDTPLCKNCYNKSITKPIEDKLQVALEIVNKIAEGIKITPEDPYSSYSSLYYECYKLRLEAKEILEKLK